MSRASSFPCRRPKGERWQAAKLYRVELYETRFPLSGVRLMWCRVGHKWVHLAAPNQLDKFKIRRTEWQKLYPQEVSTCSTQS